MGKYRSILINKIIDPIDNLILNLQIKKIFRENNTNKILQSNVEIHYKYLELDYFIMLGTRYTYNIGKLMKNNINLLQI